MMTNKKPDERLDDLQVKGYEIIQKPGRFCFGMDAVLLSSYAKVNVGNVHWILGPEPEFFRFYWKQRIRDFIIQVWKFRKKVLIWQEEAWHTTGWRIR